MAEAYIIDTLRTPVGRRNGGLSHVHPIDLGAFPCVRSWRETTSTPRRSTT